MYTITRIAISYVRYDREAKTFRIRLHGTQVQLYSMMPCLRQQTQLTGKNFSIKSVSCLTDTRRICWQENGISSKMLTRYVFSSSQEWFLQHGVFIPFTLDNKSSLKITYYRKSQNTNKITTQHNTTNGDYFDDGGVTGSFRRCSYRWE